MPHLEIIHSGEHWQTLRRAKAARKARRTAQQQPDYIPGDGLIYTFIPGQPTPITSVLNSDGSLIPIPGQPLRLSSPKNTGSSSLIRKPTPRSMGTNSLAAVLACAAKEDEQLLTRLNETPDARKKRKRVEELAKTERTQKKKLIVGQLAIH
ncbi:hypothetical protein B0H13DRAFT_1910141 [Mycena leptocephala]|nr:hypothetical protein B0H13DRAFT_1910141 [Mycena leptocephala]